MVSNIWVLSLIWTSPFAKLAAIFRSLMNDPGRGKKISVALAGLIGGDPRWHGHPTGAEASKWSHDVSNDTPWSPAATYVPLPHLTTQVEKWGGSYTRILGPSNKRERCQRYRWTIDRWGFHSKWCCSVAHSWNRGNYIFWINIFIFFSSSYFTLWAF